MAVLEVKDLVCSFRAGGPGSGMKKVLNGVSLTVDERSCLGLIGDSGSGKSTIARCIAGLTRPDAGSISIDGRCVYPETGTRKMLAGRVQMLYQDHAASFDPIMTIGDSLAEGVRARTGTRSVDRDAVGELLHRVGLGMEVCEKFPRQLSGGERQRAALARSLSVEPSLLVLDEPTSSLDTQTQDKILALVGSLQKTQGTALLFVSHDIEAVVRICDRIAVLCDGRIVEYGETSSILSTPVHPYTRRIAQLNASFLRS